jgi:hypothetical protein
LDSLIEETTEPLPNGAALPDHPANTTALKVVEYGKVWDDGDGRPLQSGRLGENEIRMLMLGNQMALQHLYCYAIRDKKIYHTRRLVTVDVKCREVAE